MLGLGARGAPAPQPGGSIARAQTCCWCRLLLPVQDPETGAANGERETLGHLLSRMLSLLSNPEPMLPAFEAAAAAERERQRTVAEQRMLMAAYLEQQRQLAVQQAQHPLDLSNGPTAAYFGVSKQQQELQRQQQELFALACQPVAPAAQQAQQPAGPTNGALAAAASGPQQQNSRQQTSQLMELGAGGQHAAVSGATDSLAAEPDGEAAAPSGEPELRAAAATERPAEAADEGLALARATAQAAIAAAVRAVDGHARSGPGLAAPPARAASRAPEAQAAAVPPLTADQVAAALAAQQVPAMVPTAAVPVAVPALDAAQLAAASACLSPPPPPPLPASAAAAAADEVDQWLAPYSSDSDGGKHAGGGEALGPVAGTLHCRRAAGAGEPPLANAEEALPPAVADGGVLRLRGGGSRKRPASAGGGNDADDAAKRQHVGGGGSASGEAERFGPEVVGRSLMVYWKEQKTYYTGSITKFHPDSG